ncbi:MAG: arginine--tRNA ligase, partial [Phycisphaerae bacterium]|nr:arginine--tRNA ligase [Phycisphaerae bacterium]
MNLRQLLESRLIKAFAEAGATGAAALVAPAGRPEFGDYQANGVMAAAGKLKTNPRKFAEKVAAAADVSDLAEPLEVAGPGFINIRLKSNYLADRLAQMGADEHLGVEKPACLQRIVVDYSGPNLAKEMH